MDQPSVGERAGMRGDLAIARIAEEFSTALEMLAPLSAAVSVFGSTRIGRADPMYRMAERIGRLLAQHGYAVLTGAGPGVMEAANKGAYEAGGLSVGLNADLPQNQAPNHYLTRLVTFRHVFIRKVMFVRHSVAFVILPGGFGTLDELFESVMLIQTRKIKPFPVVLVGTDYWAGLLEWLRDPVLKQGKIAPEELAIIRTADSADEVVQIIDESCRPTRRE
jgi:hypothetical protein